MTRNVSGNTVVVQGVEQGSVFPSDREETTKDILIDGRSSPFDVRGGVYSNSLSIVGSGTVRGPVLAGANLRMEVAAPGIQRLLGGLSAHHSAVAQPIGDAPLDASPAATTGGIRFVIRGDINAEKVVLRNALVVGSISSPSVRIQNSIVLGSIISRSSPGELHAICSSFGLFDVKRLIIEGPTTLSLAAGASDDPPEFRDHDANLEWKAPDREPDLPGERLEPRLRLLSLCRIKETGCGIPNEALQNLPEGTKNPERFGNAPGISCEYWLFGACPHMPRVNLYPSDFVEMLVESSGNLVRVLGEDEHLGTATLRKRWFFGIQSRALHAAALEKTDAAFQELLHLIFAYEHLDDRARARLKESLESDAVSSQETLLFRSAIEGLESRF